MQAIGRKCFDPKKGTNFERERLEVWPGYLTSVKPLGAKKDNILLNIDICYKVVKIRYYVAAFRIIVKYARGIEEFISARNYSFDYV